MPLSPPPNRHLDDLLPAELPLMMGVGPTPLPPSVAAANARIINHLGPLMNGVVEAFKDNARYVLQTQNDRVFGISGPGSAAMEMAVANLVWPGRRQLAIVNGTFSKRAALMGQRCGGEVEILEVPAGQGVDPDVVRERMAASAFDVVTMVQGETSCGALNAALPEVAAIARERGALVVVDAVVTLSTLPLQTDDWGIDVVFTAGQKGLGSVPGVSLITFSDRAWDAVSANPGAPTQWVLDARLAEKFWMGHTYHYTAPTPGVLALYEALRLICEETLPARHARHALHSAAMTAGVEALGLSLFAAPEHRLPTALAIRLPEGLADAKGIQRELEQGYGVQVAGAFGLPIFRIGQMAEQCRRGPVLRTLRALGGALNALGVAGDAEAAVAAAEGVLAAG